MGYTYIQTPEHTPRVSTFLLQAGCGRELVLRTVPN
jgi:hypothetical protein